MEYSTFEEKLYLFANTFASKVVPPSYVSSFSNAVCLKNQLSVFTGVFGTSSSFAFCTPAGISKVGCFLTISVTSTCLLFAI